MLRMNVHGVSNDDGKYRAPKMWKLKNKIAPKSSDVPSAKKDDFGNLATSHKQLMKLYEETYRKRLEHREIAPELSDVKEMKERLFDLRMEIAKTKVSDPWSEEDLLKVVKSLKRYLGSNI